MTGYANWHSGEVESLVPVGSTPTSVTDKENDPVVQRQRRLGDNQESDSPGIFSADHSQLRGEQTADILSQN